MKLNCRKESEYFLNRTLNQPRKGLSFFRSLAFSFSKKFSVFFYWRIPFWKYPDIVHVNPERTVCPKKSLKHNDDLFYNHIIENFSCFLAKVKFPSVLKKGCSTDL